MVTGAVADRCRVAARAVQLGFAEFRSSYTVTSWLFGWCLRLVFQVVFFTLIGAVVGGATTIDYLLVGNVVAVAALEATAVVVSMVREKWYGTLALVLASPGSPTAALVAGNLNWPVTGLLSASVTMLVAVLVFGVPVTVGGVLLALPLVLVCALSAFCYGSAIAVVVLRFPSFNFTAMNVAYLSLMAFTGVNVPTSFWPPVIQWVVQILPITHGLSAVRAVLAGAPLSGVLGQVLAEIAVGLGWLLLAVVSIHRFVARGRRDGGLDFAS
jgi:ABC-2 type transport system permease protein